MSERKSFEQLRQEIRALGGDGWDNVADVDAELRAIRGECSKDCEQIQAQLTAAQARVAELEKARLSAMVLVYEPELTHSVWQDYGGLMNEETGEEIIRSQEERINDLKAGVLRGEWVAWRLIRIEKEVMGNE